MARAPSPHKTDRDRLVLRARLLVSEAVKRGEMPHVSTLPCADCGKPAECYDHRDYTKPLEVAAVCKGCNNRRGPGLPLPTKEDGQVNKHGIDGNVGRCWDGMDAGEGFEPLTACLAIDVPFDIETDFDRPVSGWSWNVSRRFSSKERLTHSWADRADYFKRRDPWYA